MKVDKYIGQSGFTSRRKACELIEQKKVEVNGKTATLSTRVNEGDTVKINGELLALKAFVPVYIAYNKPKGIICTSEKIAGNIIDAVNHPEKVYPVGRLDKDSEGLILLTNHGELNDRITHPRFEHEKEYIVTLNLPLRKKFLDEIAAGITIQGETTKPCQVSPEAGTKRIFRIVLTQGMNRQIRRMCNAYDYQVIKLQRIRVMNIELGKLKPGEWRNLTAEELKPLLDMLATAPPEMPVIVPKKVSTPRPKQTTKREKPIPKRLTEAEAKEFAIKAEKQARKLTKEEKRKKTKAVLDKIKPHRKRKDNRAKKRELG